MKLLPFTKIGTFRNGLNKRVQQTRTISLSPVLGLLHGINKWYFGCIFVDNENPQCVGLICVKIKKLTEDDVDYLSLQGQQTNNYIIDNNNNNNNNNNNSNTSLLCEHRYYDTGEDTNGSWMYTCWSADVDKVEDVQIRDLADKIVPGGNSSFFLTEEILLRKIKEVCQLESEFKINFIVGMLALEKDNFQSQHCHPDYDLMPLKKEDFGKIMTYPGTYAWTRKQILELSLNLHHTCGAYEKGTGELAAWAFLGVAGDISAVCTAKEHRKKGLAKTVITKLCELCFDNGWPVFAYYAKYSDGKSISRDMLKKLSFKHDEKASYSFCLNDNF